MSAVRGLLDWLAVLVAFYKLLTICQVHGLLLFIERLCTPPPQPCDMQ